MRGLLAIVYPLIVALGAGAVEVICIAPDTPHGASEEIFYRVEVTSNGTVAEATGLAVSLYVNGATLTAASATLSAATLADAVGQVLVNVLTPPVGEPGGTPGDVCVLVLTVQAAGDTRRVPLDAWITSRLRAR